MSKASFEEMKLKNSSQNEAGTEGTSGNWNGEGANKQTAQTKEKKKRKKASAIVKWEFKK